MHGSKPTPNATAALSHLAENSIEYVLLTNGGGKSESARTAELSSYLNTPIHPSQFIQSHTPLAAYASNPEFNTVLVIGGEADNCRHVATEYGFRNVILPCDILAAYPAISPFSVNKTPEYARPLPEGEVKIDAIFVFNDPRDWALDLQLIVDVLLSEDGRLGTRRTPMSERPHVPLFFSNPDLVWANEYHLPRLGQGGFRSAFTGVWGSVVRKEWNDKRGAPKLEFEVIGKPHYATYKFAEDILCEWRKKQLKFAGVESGEGIQTVYMVGDNPASDIVGANTFQSNRGVEWVSVLVKGGVYRTGDSTRNAKAVVEDVLEAVTWAIAREEKEKDMPRTALGEKRGLVRREITGRGQLKWQQRQQRQQLAEVKGEEKQLNKDEEKGSSEATEVRV